ncbi:hypothetical protein FDECE_3802 [Fusarium decemcellulare]|nr:hypothetical protein FDECE_3802 [Fusarium decemcellulare]
MSNSSKLHVAVAGVGRMGLRHAEHFHKLVADADLIAVSSPVQAELDAAKELLPHVRTYLSYDEMLNAEPRLQAVVIASAVSVHAEQSIKAMEKGLHVLCEKPLSPSPEISQQVLDAYRKSIKKYPQQKVMCGFSRRFDASYRDAYQQVVRGDLGRLAVFRSQTCDLLNPAFFAGYLKHAAGIFIDTSIHDVDLALWFLGHDSVVKSISAAGVTAVQQDMLDHTDRDNAMAIIEFHDGKIAQLYASRMMAAGQEDTTELICTKGKATVNAQPQTNLVNIHDPTGIRRQVPGDYYGRFREAFITEAQEFTDCCLNDKELPVKLEGAVKAVTICCLLQESLISGKKLEFDESGRRLTPATGVKIGSKFIEELDQINQCIRGIYIHPSIPTLDAEIPPQGAEIPSRVTCRILRYRSDILGSANRLGPTASAKIPDLHIQSGSKEPGHEAQLRQSDEQSESADNDSDHSGPHGPRSRHNEATQETDDRNKAVRQVTDPDGVLPPSPTSTPLPPEPKRNESVAWSDLPQKQQLFIITLARMSEPLVQSSLQAYMFYQLKWFDPDLPDSTISAQAGVLHASFTAAQFVTAMLWGRVADSPRAGRKTVLLIGLCGTSLSCLGFGFATSFWQALVFRTIGGATNGNVGVMRTMISEIIREKKYQSRAFLLLPMTFNCGIILGPIMGGLLSDPAGSYPGLFGSVDFFIKYPYATPNIISSVFLAIAALAVWLGLEETLDALRDHPQDVGSRIGHRLASFVRRRFFSRNTHGGYAAIPTEDVELAPDGEPVTKRPVRRYTQRLPFRRMFTRNVTMTFAANFLLGIHIGTFNSLWFVFLSTPVWNPEKSEHQRHLPFLFTGGLGLPPRSVGLAMAILGFIGINLQLFLYPRISGRFGTTKAWRFSLFCFPIAYFLVPYLSVVPSSDSSPPPSPKGGILIWLAICGVLSIQVLGRTFAIPSQTILINNCSPHPSVLGTIHGLGQSVSSAARTVGPMIGGVIYGFGLNKGVVGLVWWILSCIGICGILASLFVKEGDGHEIWLEGDEDETVPEADRTNNVEARH